MARDGAKIDRAAIVEAAFAVLALEGLDGLNLRRVAARLDAQAPALYWHVRDKSELLGLMVQVMAQSVTRAKAAAVGWREKLIAAARSLRAEMLKRRDSARLFVSAQPPPSPDDMARTLAAPLVSDGLTARQALQYQAAVIAYTVGWVAYEQSQTMHAYLARMIDFDESFESGLLAMVGGLAARESATRSAKATARERQKLV